MKGKSKVKVWNLKFKKAKTNQYLEKLEKENMLIKGIIKYMLIGLTFTKSLVLLIKFF